MEDKQLQETLSQLAADIAVLRVQMLANRFAFTALARTYPNKPALADSFAREVEHVMADSLTRDYPEPLLDIFRREFEDLRGFLQRIVQEENQRKG